LAPYAHNLFPNDWIIKYSVHGLKENSIIKENSSI
jgi:hypothetical protein